MPRDLSKEATSGELSQLTKSPSQMEDGETPGIPLDESTLVDILSQSKTVRRITAWTTRLMSIRERET